MPLNTQQRAVVDAARDLSRRVPALQKVGELGRLRDDAGFEALAEQARQEAERYRRKALREQFDAEEKQKQLARRLARDEELLEGLTAARKAVEGLDSWLIRGETISQRIKQGRSSLWNGKLDRRLRDQLQTEETQAGEKLEIEVSPQMRRTIQQDLSTGYRGWAEYVIRELTQDLVLAAYERWTTLEQELPVDNPWDMERGALRAVAPGLPWESHANGWWDANEPPAMSRSQPLPAFWTELGRTLRQQVFPVAALLSVAGIAQLVPGGSRGALILLLLPLMLPVAWFVVNRDRNKRLEKLQQDAEKSLQDELVRWAGGRLERAEARLTDFCRYQLKMVVRPKLIAWYRQEVLPQLNEARESVEMGRRALQASERAGGGRGPAPGEVELARFLDQVKPAGAPTPG
jgi:hypothetical protein